MKTLVTGGGGFLGGAIIERLLTRGDSVRSYARGDYPELRRRGVQTFRGDVGNPADLPGLREACAGCDAVFHVAAMVGVSVRAAPFERTNIDGTRHVIDACRAMGVSRLIYTSTPSVIADGSPAEGVDESRPYPAHHESHYGRTKAIAERWVLQAGRERLRTVALRPHLVWGPGDNHLIPRILARAHKLRRIGGANPLVDSTYIDNAADAHILAADALQERGRTPDPSVPAARGPAPLGPDPDTAKPSGPSPAGRAYFISNGEPRPLWDLVNAILAAAGRPPVTRSIPVWTARSVAAACEFTYRLLALRSEPPLTRFVASELTRPHWFDITAAQRELGYTPRVTTDEGLARLKAWFDAGAAALY